MRIGPYVIDPPLVLAPLAGISTPACRILAEEHGCSLTWTEMVSAPGLLSFAPRVRSLVQPSRPAHPMAVQLVAARPEDAERAAAVVAELGAQLIDLNMGCPIHKVVKTGAGVALMRDPARAEAVVRAAIRGVGDRLPITVKMRLGWDRVERNAAVLAQRLVAAGVAAVTVHGRTREQGFGGKVDLEGIREVVHALEVPVIGNGSVVDEATYRTMRETTGCAGVMIGRAARGNPWLFGALRAVDQGLSPPPLPAPADRIAAMRRHLALELERAPVVDALRDARKHLIWYSRGLQGSVAFRRAIQGQRTTAEFQRLIACLEEESACPDSAPNHD